MKPAGIPALLTVPTPPPGLRKRRGKRILAVGGGKGGIGKTLVSANLSIALARQGRRVVLVDADFGGANVHTALGMPQPSHSLSDFVTKRVEKLGDLAAPSGVEGLSVIAGASDALDAANMKFQQKQKLLRHVQALDADYVVLDLGAGTSFNTLDFFLLADHGILVLLPEPTSIENAYRFVKAAFFRHLSNLGEELGIADQVEDAMSSREGALRTPFEFVERIASAHPDAAARLSQELRTFRVKLVVNQSRTSVDVNVGHSVVSAWKKFFGLEMDYLGAISYDDEAWRSIRRRRPVLLDRPDSEAAKGITRMAERVLGLDAEAR